MENQLWLGTSKVDITPRHPLPLAGFALRHGKTFEGIRHPLHARIFAFRHRGADGGETTALLVSADLLWWGSERVPALKRRIRRRWGIPEEAVLFHGTHTHSGPQTSDRFSALLGEHDPDYIAQLEHWVMEGIAEAMNNQEPVSAEFGTGRSYLGVNRRLMVDGQCLAQANKDGPFDPTLRVVRFWSDSGRAKAILVHYACHPTVTPENAVSSEFCGVAMDILERTIGGGVVSGYVQGWCGDINPVKRGQLFFDGTDKDVRRFARRLADSVLRVLGGPMRTLDASPLAAKSMTVEAPLQKLPTIEELRQWVDEPWVKGDWSRRLLAEPERLKPHLPLEITLLTLADGWRLLAANSEVVTEYGLYVKSIGGEGVWPIGYTNGMIGYVPTAKQIDEGGYEALWSTEYFLMPAPFAHEVEPMFRGAIRALVESEPKTSRH
jgi:Neutral/alkaline non-lysosomal ceramidase.